MKPDEEVSDITIVVGDIAYQVDEPKRADLLRQLVTLLVECLETSKKQPRYVVA